MVVLVAVVSFLGSCIGLWLTGRVLDALPLSASFPDTPIHGLTYAELGACAAEGSAAATREKTVQFGITTCAQGATLGLSVLPNCSRFSHVSLRRLLPRRLLAEATVTSLLFAYCVGLMNGSLFGRRHVVLITVAATIPPFAMLMGLAAVTLGVGLIASPMVAAYGVAVIGGVRRASRYRLPSA